MSKVYIGVGHGGTDCGAVGNGFEEEDLTLSVAKACTAYLTAHGVMAKQSRTADVDFNTAKKVIDANNFCADLVLDIHINAGGGKGTEVYHSICGGTSKTLAQNILDTIITDTGETNRGLKTKLQSNGKDYFGIIRDTHAPAVLVECCFIDSIDIQHIDTAAEQVTFGQAIAKGVLKTLGITTKTAAPAEPHFKVSICTGEKSECETILKWVQEHANYTGIIEELK